MEKMEKPIPLPWLLAGIAILLGVFVSLVWKAGRIQAPETPLPKDDKFTQYEDIGGGFSFRYPKEIETGRAIAQEVVPPQYEALVPGILIFHEIPVQYCSLKGDCFPKTRDFSLGVFTVPRPYAAISSEVKKTIGGDETILNGRPMYFAQIGAEGEGVFYYFLPISQTSTVLLTHRYMDEQVMPTYKTAPGFISFSRQKDIMHSILNTVVFPRPYEAASKMKVKVFFGSSEKVPTLDCGAVYPVEREVIKTIAPARAALEELLSGPTEEEKQAGYFSAVPSGSRLVSLNIKEGMASAVLNEDAQSGGGSCSMEARLAQIRQTLLQFPTVKNVQVSVEMKAPGESFQP
jgi:hypothetical protein